MISLPKISVVIPNFNNEKYLSLCIDSVMAQDYPNLEVVVVDDASTDNSIKILNEYQKKDVRFNVIYKAQNEGVVAARNDGIRSATGEYIATLDSDDIYTYKQKISDEYRCLSRFATTSSRPVIAFSQIQLIDEKGGILGTPSRVIPDGEVFAKLLSRSTMIPRDFLVHKDLFNVVGGYNKNIPLYEDWDLKLRLSKIADFRYTGKIGIGYRRHSGGLSSTRCLRHIYWLTYVFLKNISFREPEAIIQALTPFLRHCFSLSKRAFSKSLSVRKGR